MPEGRARWIEGAETAWSNSNFGSVHRIVQPFAENGDPKAQLWMGRLYYVAAAYCSDDGLDEIEIGWDAEGTFEQNCAKSLDWHRQAAEQAYPAAQLVLAGLYDGSLCTERDLDKHMYWLQLAAWNGSARAQFDLGWRYRWGKSSKMSRTEVPKDPVQALAWFIIAESNGEKLAVHNRERLAAELAPKQIAEAERLAAEWRAKIKAAD